MEIPNWSRCRPPGPLTNTKDDNSMINHITRPDSPAAARQKWPGIEDLDLSPQGLADAPASQQDLDSLVHPGNS